MKGTVYAVALNHQSQRDAWAEAFEKAPYNTPPKTAVWFIKPHNTVIRAGEPIPFPQGETVLSGATVALVVGKTASKVRVEEAAAYIAGYALANEVSLPEESFYRPAIKAKCRDGFCPLGELVTVDNVDNLTIITEINGREADHWNTAGLQRSAAELLSALSEFATLNPGMRYCSVRRKAASRSARAIGYASWRKVSRRWKTRWWMSATWPSHTVHILTPRCSPSA